MATCVVTGTITTTTTKEADIVAGGKTIILTLTGDTWVASGATFNAQRQAIINGLTSSLNEATGWNAKVKGLEVVTAVVRTSATVVTITLTASATYAITAFETITATVPAAALTGAVAIVSTPNFWVYDTIQTFYVRKSGSDSNSGASPSEAWLTVNKAISAIGILSGDTCYVGGSLFPYRELLTANMTSAVAETKIIGDVTGKFTGDAGEVVISAYLTNDLTSPSGTTLLNLNGRDFLTFQDITFIGGNTSIVTSTTLTSTDIKFTRDCFMSGGTGQNGSAMAITLGANTAGNWVIDSCIFWTRATGINLTLTRPTGADFDYNMTFKNCIAHMTGGSFIVVNATGANTFNGGGVDVYNCTYFGSASLIITNSANLSTSIPCTAYNNFLYTGGNGGLSANASGQIVEDYNVLICSSSPRTNVTAGTHSRSDGSVAPLFFTGAEFLQRGLMRPVAMPLPGSPLLGYNNQASSPSVDILSSARPSGLLYLSSGTATAGGAKTLTDSGKTWIVNAFVNASVKIISGTGSGQTKSISSNTATILTLDGNWKTNPDNTSVYEIYQGAYSSSGTATAGSTTTLTDSNAAWGVNMWAGFTLKIDGGTGSGQSLLVVSNTATIITFATATAPDNTSTYKLYKGTDENTINAGIGAFEGFNTAVRETTTVRTGANAIRIAGAGNHSFDVPVSAALTTITIYTQWDAAYAGTKPSMNIINGKECGVSDATSTAVGSSGSWEQLTLTFTPTAAGIITVKLISASTTPTGNSFWDDWATS